MGAFRAIIGRDLRLAFRQGGDGAMAVMFFVLAAILFPFGIGPEGWTAIFTAVLALTTVVLAVVAAVQIEYLRRSDKTARISADAAADANRIAREQIEMTQRARVSILAMSVSRNVVFGKIVVSCSLQNAGQLPASHVLICQAMTNGTDWHPPKRAELHIAPQIEEMGLVFAPGETEGWQEWREEFSVSDYEAAERGEIWLRVRIIVSYFDGIGGDGNIGRERTTWKWFQWHPETGAFQICSARQD